MKTRRALGVTGTPCTGKKSVAALLAGLLGSAPIDLNSVAKEISHVHRGLGPDEELVVDTDRLRRALLDRDLSGAVVSGHLLPDVLRARELGFVAVLRCEPRALKKRLAARGYGHAKVVENLEAELIGSVLDAAVRAFGKRAVHEYDTTRASPRTVAERIARDFRSRSAQKRPWIDWTLGYGSSAKLRLLLSEAASTGPAST